MFQGMSPWCSVVNLDENIIVNTNEMIVNKDFYYVSLILYVMICMHIVVILNVVPVAVIFKGSSFGVVFLYKFSLLIHFKYFANNVLNGHKII